MVPQNLTLRQNGQVTLNASGYGFVKLGPTAYNEVWTVNCVAARVSSNTLEPEFRCYVGAINDASFIGGSYSGSMTADSTLNQEIPGGSTIIGEWRNGNPGATATMTVNGRTVIG